MSRTTARTADVRRAADAVLPVVAACDLDRTLVYSRKAARLGLPDGTHEELVRDLACVEIYESEPLSYVTQAAHRTVEALARTGALVPATTRTRAQYERIMLPGPQAPYAVTANGGFLLVDGVADQAWTDRVTRVLAESSHPFAEVEGYMASVFKPEWTSKLRSAEGLFCYAVVRRQHLPEGFVDEVADWARAHGWRASLQGRKLYVVPDELRKGAAVAEVARRTDAHTVVAAGDSLLDAEMLESATRAIRPAHGELHDVGWTTPGLTVTGAAGAAAGEEIASWLLAQVTEGAAG
ncbi:HAD family hydrolase [Sanguibacter suaedae]|uniref:HAD family hydrolase n=1 Tax=Sanguibacter suaedae TaxID=2795737 RepID=UPI0027DB8548|nr:HAD family hydrolase [Sanguibacter suaedae]